MLLRCGTSGFSYPQWRGTFYPEGMGDAEMLAHYAGRLPTVEINNTFYRMPKADVVARWGEQVPAGFTFVLKGSRRITHLGKLRAPEAHDSMTYLWKVADVLGAKLGPVLLQTPPYLKADAGLLREFVAATIPPGRRVAFELQGAGWDTDEVDHVIVDAGGARCIADREDGTARLPRVGSWAYLRLRRDDYSEDEQRAWLARLAATGVSEAFVFFKHEDTAHGPAMAEQMQRLGAELG